MKKHPQADMLAARLTDAANKPVSVVPFPPPTNLESDALPSEPESEVIRTALAEESRPRRRRRARASAQLSEETEDDTVAISIRPRRELLTRYVLAASERTRETGRVISAQQIMLERLEGGP
jgi:hypothetical protein